MANSTRLSVLGLGLALGTTWALSMLILGLAQWHFGYGGAWVQLLGTVYVGYGPTILGSLFGLVWGFVDGFIGGVVIAWLYNKFS